MIILVEESADFIEILKKDVNVKDAVVAELSDSVVVAVLTQGVFSRSEGNSLEKRLSLYTSAYFQDKTVFVTRDADIFYKIKAAKTDEELVKILKVLSARKYVEK